MLVKWLLLLGIAGNFTNIHVSSIHPPIYDPSSFPHSFNTLTALCCAPSEASVTNQTAPSPSGQYFMECRSRKVPLCVYFGACYWRENSNTAFLGSGRGRRVMLYERA